MTYDKILVLPKAYVDIKSLDSLVFVSKINVSMEGDIGVLKFSRRKMLIAYKIKENVYIVFFNIRYAILLIFFIIIINKLKT